MLQANCPVHGQWKKLMLRIPPDVHGAALVARYQWAVLRRTAPPRYHFARLVGKGNGETQPSGSQCRDLAPGLG
jgi:hypothetical protein